MSVLIWIQTVCKGYQQKTQVNEALTIFMLGKFARFFVGPDLDPNCLQRLSTEDTSK